MYYGTTILFDSFLYYLINGCLRMATLKKSAENRKGIYAWDLMKSYWLISSSEKWYCALGGIRGLDVCVSSTIQTMELYSAQLQSASFYKISICTSEPGRRKKKNIPRKKLLGKE